MSTFSKLAENLVNLTKDAIKTRSIPVDDLRTVIKENIETHKKLHQYINSLNPKEYKDIYPRYSTAMKSSKLVSQNVYQEYTKHLLGKAKSNEDKFFLNSLAEANDTFVGILTDIGKNLNTLIEDRVINVKNVRMTAISVLGILRQSNILAMFTKFMFAQVSAALTDKVSEIPQYRSKYLMEHVDKVSNIVSQVSNKTGAYMFLQEAKELKNKNADLVLGVNPNGMSFLNLLNNNNYTKGFLDNINTLLSVLNIFRWTQEKWDDYLDECHRANKETLSWMESHVAILRMELNNIDRNDPKYQQMQKIIEAYDMRIAEYDRKIKDYEEGN